MYTQVHVYFSLADLFPMLSTLSDVTLARYLPQSPLSQGEIHNSAVRGMCAFESCSC